MARGRGLRRFFGGRESNFLALLQEQAQLTLRGLEALDEFAQTGDRQVAARVEALEKEEDEVRRVLIDELNRTFVTPIDREDIFALSRAIDDVLDYGYTTVDEMTILDVAPNEHVRRMVAILKDAAEAIYLAVKQMTERPQIANEHAVRAKQLENRVETLYREAVAELFHGINDLSDVVYVLKMREVYRHLSNAADRGDEAANVIGDIVVKMP